MTKYGIYEVTSGHPRYNTGQYTIRGVPESYAVLGENYRLQCNVTDSPSGVEFRRNNVAVCNMINCESSSTDNRYKCGCINDNNKTLYLNISNINKQDDTTWSCRGNSGGQGSATVPVYCKFDLSPNYLLPYFFN
ncbi:hypothetical protein LOTGIDRAFT_174559 [Lottia gigantea]|uniref:Ig-like domain-containing protein n=1 Tax=Lottia gigantea TaxID=225164 RepID=V4A046_LOTGI|nr:hypothetical protein LOTGIDRAFT_174559 [Lottia gigantea]ESO97173.1 hypothetical protein LOTGIDRAFT_174559 [Lottia gigantea]